MLGAGGFAHGPDFRAQLGGEGFGFGPITVSDDDDFGADLGDVAPGEAVAEGDGEDAVLAFQRLHAGDEAFHRLDRGAPHGNAAAVVIGDDRLDLALRGGEAEGVEFAGAVADIGVRVFLVGDDDVCGGAHRLRQVAVQVELDPQHRVRADDGAGMGQQVAFAIIVAIGDHGAVHFQQHDIDRAGSVRMGGAQIGEDGVAVVLVDVAQGGAGRLGEGAHALDNVQPVGLGQFAPFLQRQIAVAGGAEAAVAAVIALRGKAGVTGGDGGKRVGFGGQSGKENLHRMLPFAAA